MKYLKRKTLSMVSAALLMLGLATAPTVNAIMLTSGAACSAATLGQALLGLTNSQNGVVNNADIPLFVVCSVDLELLTALTVAVGDVGAEGVFPAAPAASAATPGAIACTLRNGTFGAPGFASAAFTIASGIDTITPGVVSPLRGFDTVDTENGAGTAGAVLLAAAPGGNNTLVCALDPGEGIAFVISI